MIRVHLLGAFRVERGTKTIRFPTRKVESLFAFLVLHPEPHPREKLAALFWGDSADELARRSLRTALSTLRQELGEDVLIADRETIQLNPDFPLWVDVRQVSGFKSQVSDPNEPSIENLKSKIENYSGDLLPDQYDDWILSERERLRAIYLDALLLIAQHHREKSEYARAMEIAQKILATDPANEKAYQHLMFCSAVLGDRIGALKQYDECAKKLREELGVEPSQETIALRDRIEQELTGTKAREALLTNLPHPLTSFIGRDKEIAAVKPLLAQHRLVTLTGSGGCGKTRLAIEIASNLVEMFLHGVWWVDLAPLSDPGLVPQAVAQSLGVHEAPNQSLEETLVHFLRTKHLLLVLDNCEHLIAASANLADKLLSACAELKILATSREALNHTGEVAWRVPSLTLPDALHLLPVGQLSQFDAVRLFAERARAITTHWKLDEQVLAVAHICRRLDGIPLAIELATARLKVLSMEEIATRLDDRFNLLTTGSYTALPRQRTLRATIDWSYDLLSNAERALLHRLSVFVGEWALEAAESVCIGNGIDAIEVLDLMARLVDKSLVLVEECRGETRYRMLETIRQYAREKLDASSETANTRNRHLEFFTHFVEKADPKLRGPEQMLWFDHLDTEFDNIRAALQWANEDGDVDAGLRLAGSVLWFCAVRGYYAEGRMWCERLLARGAGASKPARAIALKGSGGLAWFQRDYPRAKSALETSLTLYRELGDKPNIGFVLNLLAVVADVQKDWAQAKTLYEESLAVRREIGDKWGIARVLRSYGVHAHSEHDYARAKKFSAEALALFREVGDRRGVARTLAILSTIAVAQQNLIEAIPLLEEATLSFFEIRDKWSLGSVLEQEWAALAVWQGDARRAARLLGAAEALRETIGTPLSSIERVQQDAMLDKMRAQLGEASFVTAWNEGRAMSFEQVVAYALEKNSA